MTEEIIEEIKYSADEVTAKVAMLNDAGAEFISGLADTYNADPVALRLEIKPVVLDIGGEIISVVLTTAGVVILSVALPLQAAMGLSKYGFIEILNQAYERAAP